MTYLLHDNGNNIYKIGTAKDVNERIKAFCQHPNISIIATTEDDIESKLHELFSQKRVGSSEWFCLSEDDVKVIRYEFGDSLELSYISNVISKKLSPIEKSVESLKLRIDNACSRIEKLKEEIDNFDTALFELTERIIEEDTLEKEFGIDDEQQTLYIKSIKKVK